MLRGLVDQAFVLVADDDPRTLQDLRAALSAEGARVITCKTARLAAEGMAFHRPSAVVLDPSFDAGRGWDVFTAAAELGRPPIVALDREHDDAVPRAAFAAGADDVIAKPVDAARVAARVSALIRRGKPETRTGPTYRHNGLVVDPTAHEVWQDGDRVVVTAQQFAILVALLEAGGGTLARSTLLAHIASLDDEQPLDRAVDLHVSRLRRRLGDDAAHPRFIEAVYGVGYRLAPAQSAHAELGTGVSIEQVLDALPDALLIVDQALRVRYANAMATRTLGRSATSLAGAGCAEVLGCTTCRGESLAGPRCYGRAVLTGGGTLRDAPGRINSPEGPLDVLFSYGRFDDNGVPQLAITLRPRTLD